MNHYFRLFIVFVYLFNLYVVNVINNEYNSDNFSFSKLKHKEYRCIRYYEENDFNKVMELTCENYKHVWLNFSLTRSCIICMIAQFNLASVGIIIVYTIYFQQFM